QPAIARQAGKTRVVVQSTGNTAMNLHRLHGADNIAEACRTTAFSTDRGLSLITDHRNTWSRAC
ncbi:MAG TPA: hypothetical protein VME67_16785, partial [Mycobacterium sp.]|nr:hypothetical protein [Mycobacterium sp.]